MADNEIEIRDGVEYLNGLPIVGATPAPVSEDTPTDEGTGLGLGTIGRGVMRMPEVLVDRLGGLMNAAGDIPGAVSSLFGKGQIPLGMPNPIGDLRNAPTGVQALGNLLRDLVQRPGVVATAGGVGGAVAGGPLGWLTTALLGTSGAELGNQANQIFGTVADTPIGDDVEKAIAGGGIDTLGGVVLGAANSLAAKPTRSAAKRAARPGDTLSASFGAPKGTTGQHTILSETIKKHADKIIELNPFKGIDPTDPNALSKALNQASTIKERLNADKAALLAKMDDSLAGPMVRVGPQDVDAIVGAMRKEGINVTDGAIRFAKDKLINELGDSALAKMQFEAATAPANGKFQPFQTKTEFANATTINSSTARNYKNLSPSEAQEYIRRNIDDELNKLESFDTTRAATELVNESVLAARQAEESGLKLLRRVFDDKVGVVVPEVGEMNRGIFAMIDLEDQLRMASAGVTGAEVVLPGQGLPAAVQAAQPGFFRRTVGRMLPDRVSNRLATDFKTDKAMNMQAQMMSPVQEMIRRRTGQLSIPDKIMMAPDAVSSLFGGDMAAGVSAIQYLPRSAEMLEQNINEAAPVIHKAAFEQGMKATNGNPDVAGAMASRMTNEFVKVMQRGSPDEKRAVTAAIAKMNPQAFVAGDYPDEVDGAVYEPASKEQLSKNARQHFSNRAVDAITYAKQQQEAYKEGPSRILIRKTGQVSPEVLEQAQGMQDSAVFEEASRADY